MLLKTFNGAAFLLNYVRPPLSPHRQQLINAIATLDNYVPASIRSLDRKRAMYARLKYDHRSRADRLGYTQRLDDLAVGIKQNGEFASRLSHFIADRNQVSKHEMRFAVPDSNSVVVELMDHLVRDWSAENARERHALFEPILSKCIDQGKVLVPGAGLGRLATELALKGLQVETAEVSVLMDECLRFLRTCEKFELYPYIHQFSHLPNASTQLQKIAIPDIRPAAHSQLVQDFTSITTTTYDSAITLFLIDTAENFFDYFDALQRLVKRNGVWINYGPLKWGTAPRIELTMAEILTLVGDNWSLKQEWQGENRYSGSDTSMWVARYRLQGWLAVNNKTP